MLTNYAKLFSLDPPDFDRLDRKYFEETRDPIPGLLGPSNACVKTSVEIFEH